MKTTIAFIAFVVIAAMAFEVPDPFVWDDSFVVGYGDLDDQHKVLFDATREVCDHKDDADKLAELRRVIDEHFRHEEKKMSDASYVNYADHLDLHHDFEEKLSEVSTPATDDNCVYVKDWLVQHIKTIDFQYKTLL